MPSNKITAACRRIERRYKKSLHSMRYLTVGVHDTDVAKYAACLEFGSTQKVTYRQSMYFRAVAPGSAPKVGSTLTMPPRPFMQYSFQKYSKKWNDLFSSLIQANGVGFIDHALVIIGSEATADIKQTIMDAPELFEERAPLTQEIYDRIAEDHNTDDTGNTEEGNLLRYTGRLINSIGYKLNTV